MIFAETELALPSLPKHVELIQLSTAYDSTFVILPKDSPIYLKAGKIIYDGVGERLQSSPLLKKLVDSGLLGKKGGKGFYIYKEGEKETPINEDVVKILPSTRKVLDEVEIQKRVFFVAEKDQ